ncbi:4-nitrophenylphosphatase [Trachymyrmex zeteki]|uniref:4-nitrophenylphosphatase n=1 Tax=Mycetomoellerius zeteki TaxID=64791 RepID=A0A151XJA6_9HYME|nr:PREDICTED: 4-nitrophenylphosphatase-like [Trachymyrmex zeteki]KYQ60484.1 4-nitrophenylphosphatase [Trachymyrmex zeteki]
MSKTKDIIKLSIEQLQEFLTSFDTVMCDIDGVLWQLNQPIEGASESLKILQNLGKQVYLITNNSTKTSENFYKSPQCISLNLSSDHIINPIKSIVWYLKKIDFRDEVFAIVPSISRKIFREAGIRLTEQPNVSETSPSATVKEVLDRPSVKAVVVDFDINWNWSMLALAISCLQRKDVLYIAGPTDEWFQVQALPQIKVLGPGPLLNVISAQSGREPISCAKPSQILKDYVLDKCNVTNLKKCLFIGDTVNQDMKFASMCGFIKLFVGTGCDTLEQAQKEDDTCPDYYLPSLGQLFSDLTIQNVNVSSITKIVDNSCSDREEINN